MLLKEGGSCVCVYQGYFSRLNASQYQNDMHPGVIPTIEIVFKGYGYFVFWRSARLLNVKKSY